jgi:thiamine-phosphate pyrophosphorylase
VANRVAVAAEAGADGVHLDDVAEYDAARQRLGKDASIGVSTLDPDDAMTAAEAGADYVSFGGFDDPAPAEPAIELLTWWAPVMTVPCIITGAVETAAAKRLAGLGADFVAVSLAGPGGARLLEVADALGSG